MHEIGVLHKAIEHIDQIAEENHVKRIAAITFELGELAGMLPIFIEKYYPVVIENRPRFQDSKLIIKTVPAQALCNECSSLFNVMKNDGSCPICQSCDKIILGGTDFVLKEISVFK